MAKLRSIVLSVLLVVSTVATCEELPAIAKRTLTVNVVVRNMARGRVTFQLENHSAVVETGQTTAVEGIAVQSWEEDPVLQVGVTVKTSSMQGPVKKVLQMKLPSLLKLRMLGRGALVLTAVESWRVKSGKYVVIHLGRRKVVLSFKQNF